MFKDTSRPCQMIDIQHCIAIVGGREVSRPYRFCFFMFLFQPPSIYALNRILEPGVFCEPA